MKFPLIFSLLLIPALAWSDSLIRIDCMADTDGAAVFVDGTYRFDCAEFQNFPVPLSQGSHEIRAVQSVDQEFERVFTTTVELQAGIPQRVRVELPAKTLTEFGREQKRLLELEERRLAEERRARELQEQKAREVREAERKATELARQIEEDRLKAAQGDRAAMERMAKRFRQGDGVEQDIAKADELEAQAERKAAFQSEIEQLEASKWTLMTEKVMTSMAESNPDPNSSEMVMMISTVFPTIYVDAVSSPATTTQNAMVDSEIEELRREAAATVWARPDSLIAQALVRD